MSKRHRRAKEQHRPLSRGKRRWFAALALSFPILGLVAAEIVGRLLGYGGYPPVLRVAGEVEQGKLVIADQAGAISYFYADPTKPGYNNQYDFIDPKPAGVFRVFLVGESAAKGFPQPRHLASSAFLQSMLTDAWPGRTVEVINLGTTAVASFPVLGMMKEALEYEPDLIIIHTGHNEFFGAYGVQSTSRGGRSVWQLKTTRVVRSLAIVQALATLRSTDHGADGKSLMEIMAAESFVPAEDPIRQAAARNLQANISEMLALCRARGVPAVVCTMPSNLRDLHPVGADRVLGLSADAEASFNRLLEEGTRMCRTNATGAVPTLKEAVGLQPHHAGAHFQYGTALFAIGDTNLALKEFRAARDDDPMPWRAPSLHQQAIRAAAKEVGGVLCDLEGEFRAHSPGGCIGWELMDDHVHPTLRGQALMAEALVRTLNRMSGPASISQDALSRIRSWEVYAAELGDNAYDRYGVDVTLLKVFTVPFFKASNLDGYRRYSTRAAGFEASLTEAMKTIAHEWQTVLPHAGGKRPITGMVARQLMREKQYDEARHYYTIAQKAVPEYTSWHMEYVYFELACREKLAGGLSADEREKALGEINQGKFLLQRGFSQSGFTERYVGRLYQLRGEWAEAIPFLNASREKLGGFDLVAADQALFTSLVELGRLSEAREIAAYGAGHSGQYARFYQQMLQILDERQSVKRSPVLDADSATNVP